MDLNRWKARGRTLSRRVGKGWWILVALLVVVRTLLPLIVQRYINRALDESPEYTGHVGDVDLSLWRGAYQIEDIVIVKRTGKGTVPFITVERLDLSVAWRQLWRGAIVAKIDMVNPEINFVDAARARDRQFGADTRWLAILDSFSPLRIDRFRVRGGTARLRKFDGKVPVDVKVERISGGISNLTNAQKLVRGNVARGYASAAIDGATVDFAIQLDPFSATNDFTLTAEVIKLRLPFVNDLAKEYAAIDFRRGTLSVFVEVANRGGKIDGYVKPLMWDVDVFNWKQDVEQDGDNIFELFWEAVVGGVGEALENQPKDQFGTRIPLTATLEKPDIEILPTIGNVLRNAFIKAFLPRLEPRGKPKQKAEK